LQATLPLHPPFLQKMLLRHESHGSLYAELAYSSINHISAARDVHAATPHTVSSSCENSTENRCAGSLLHLHRILHSMLLSLSPEVGIFFAYCNHLCTVAEDLLLKPSLSWAYCTIGVLSLSMCLTNLLAWSFRTALTATT